MRSNVLLIVVFVLAQITFAFSEDLTFHDGPNNVTVTLPVNRFGGSGEYWKLESVVYQDSSQSGGNHNIYFEVYNSNGSPAVGQKVWHGWPDGQADTSTDGAGKANFGIYAKFWPPSQGPYRAWVDGPSDVINGMGLTCGHHVNFILKYRKSWKSDRMMEAAYVEGPLKETSSTSKETPENVRSISYQPYKQTDSRWGNNLMNYHYTQSYKIKDWGCAITSFGCAVSTDPGTLNEWLSNNSGYVPDANVVWTKMGEYKAKTYEGSYTPSSITASNVRAAIDANKIVIARVRFGSHYVLLTGHDGGNKFYCHDPYFSDTWYLYDGDGTNDHIDRYVIYR